MFKLITEIKAEERIESLIAENVNHLFAVDEVQSLYESAEKYLGKAIAALRAGKNPFETAGVDPKVLNALMAFADEDLQDVFSGVTSNVKGRISQALNANPQIQTTLAGSKYGGHPSLKTQLSRIVNMAENQPRELANSLQKLALHYSRASDSTKAA